MAFDKICRGWVLVAKKLKKLIAEAANGAASKDEDEPTKKVICYDGASLHESNEMRCDGSRCSNKAVVPTTYQTLAL